MARLAHVQRATAAVLALLAAAHNISATPAGPSPAQKPLTVAAAAAAAAAAGFVSLGDSYSAGIGTGVDGAEGDCRLGLHGYPALIHADLASRHSPAAVAFQWRSCTGATADGLLHAGGQIASLDGALPADFATLSVGGNDLGFFDVINACVFRFYSYYSGTCEAALGRAAELVAADDFELRLQVALLELLDGVAWERRPRFAVAVTGYARFFDATTAECDGLSLGVWWGGPRLSRALRARMNGLVLAANAKLRAVVARVNGRFAGAARPKALFVDYDGGFDGHRFCEQGVAEPDYGRSDTWFFLVGGLDNGGNSTGDPDDGAPPEGALLVDPDSCLGPARESGDWGLLATCYMAMAKKRDPTLRPAHVLATPTSQEGNSGWYVPTSYAKVFHPRSLGHEHIRDSIYREWKRVFGEDLISGVEAGSSVIQLRVS
ncbi:hypothetical protein RB598_009100 [Gaeumannomyces tritici]